MADITGLSYNIAIAAPDTPTKTGCQQQEPSSGRIICLLSAPQREQRSVYAPARALLEKIDPAQVVTAPLGDFSP